MRLTKYQHACFTVEKDGDVLVVDPGGFSSDFIAPEKVVAVVITHQHRDHFDTEHLAEIFDKNDEVLLLGPADVIDKIEVENKRAVEPGEKISVAPFDLEFFGGVHAIIHESYPRVQNLGIMVNDLLYYPGDSLESPNRSVDTLALPVSAPWMKLGEAIDFVIELKPRLAFPTHDAILSDIGQSMADTMIGAAAQANSIEYKRLDNPIDI